MKLNNISKLIIAIVISEFAGIIGSLFTAKSVSTWYSGLIKPNFTPPAWVFGPVWTTLFALMGISAFLIWSSYAKATEDKKKGIKIALVLFGIQLVLNTLWSIIFFGLHSPSNAFIELVVLWLVILATIIAFSKISRPAAWLLLPYIIWVSFAGYLNFSIWSLNKEPIAKLPPSSSCSLENCPFEIYATDTGKTFTYSETSRFTVFLDSNKYPKSELVCNPQGIIGEISNIPPAVLPLYATRFETISPGQCTLSDRDFSVNIIVPKNNENAQTYDSGIRGVVMLGPTCPVEHIPPLPNCADKPYSTLIAVFKVTDPVHAIILTKSNADGSFKISLPPGEYILGAGESSLPRCNHPQITVKANTYSSITISCDTGIR